MLAASHGSTRMSCTCRTMLVLPELGPPIISTGDISTDTAARRIADALPVQVGKQA